MRTKGIMFMSIYLLTTYFGKYLKKIKLLYIFVALFLLTLVSYSKIELYKSFSSSPREVLYAGSLKLLAHYFPFGSGFGTFASHISAKYYSNAYSFINLPSYYLQTKGILVTLGDAGYPYYIAQFGFFGIILILLLFYKIYKLAIGNSSNKKSITIIFIYILIAVTSESTLLNCGLEIALVIFFLFKYCKNKKLCSVNDEFHQNNN